MKMNEKLAKIFFEIADLLELQNIEWKPQAYRRAARALLDQDSVAAIYKKGGEEALEEIPGIGEGLAKKIIEYIKTGQVKELEKVKKGLPKGLSELLDLISMGPKRAMRLYKELGIRTVKDLEKAAKEHKIAKLSGFGEKSEADILESISLSKKSPGRISYAEAYKLASSIKKNLLPYCEQVEIAGSIRRKKETIGDIDLLAISNSPEKVMDSFRSCGIKTLSTGPTKTIIILKNGLQADLRVLKPEAFGAAFLYFTGPKDYNIEMRKIAIQKGYKLSEYGLFDRKTGRLISSKDEKDIFGRLGMKYVRPEDREK